MTTRGSIDKYPQVLTGADLAELLGYHPHHLREMAREGRIPGHREPGSRLWWFDRDELIEWLRSFTAAVTPLGERDVGGDG